MDTPEQPPEVFLGEGKTVVPVEVPRLKRGELHLIDIATVTMATVAAFSRSLPSTGSFITFIGKTFGPTMAITTTIVVSIGYIIAMASVIDISGGWVQIILQNYLHINIPWQPMTLVFAAIVFYLM